MQLKKVRAHAAVTQFHPCYFIEGDNADHARLYPAANATRDFSQLLDFLREQPEKSKGYIEERVTRSVYRVTE